MACCAFAAFLIGQMILAFDRLRARLGFAVPESGAPNAIAMWRLGDAAIVAPARPRLRFLPVTAAAVLVGAAAGLFFGGADGSGHMFAFDFICTQDGVVTIAGLDR